MAWSARRPGRRRGREPRHDVTGEEAKASQGGLVRHVAPQYRETRLDVAEELDRVLDQRDDRLRRADESPTLALHALHGHRLELLDELVAGICARAPASPGRGARFE